MGMATQKLDICQPDRKAAELFVAEHFADLIATPASDEEAVSSDAFRGGQTHADEALAALTLDGYTRNRTQAYPERRRGASRLSPYIRHGLLDLPTLWDAVDGPAQEVDRFRLELQWQEYARHLYARLGPNMRNPLQFEPPPGEGTTDPARVWNHDMGCVEITVGELEDDGWLVGQARLWLASQWAVRQQVDWRQGEEYFFRHLLDGSRAANRLGWQTATGTAGGRPYHFTRWQVESRAPGLCASCELNTACPIDRWPDRAAQTAAGSSTATPVTLAQPLLKADPDLTATAGPSSVQVNRDGTPEIVWITAESMGDADPALAANPDLPAVFVFDRPLLAKLRLSSKRLVFLTETLADLATRRPVEVHLGTVPEAMAGRRAAVTFAPVPGFRRHASSVGPVQVHPWPWLRQPGCGDISSFTAWSNQVAKRRPRPGADPAAASSLTRVIDAIPVAANMR